MGGEMVVVALGVVRVVAPTSHPLPGPLALPHVALVAVTVELWRALVVLVVLGEVVLLVMGGRGVATATLVQLTVPAEAMGGGDRLCPVEAASTVVLTAPGRSRH